MSNELPINFNNSVILWAVGVVQPATSSEVAAFLAEVYPDVRSWPPSRYFDDVLNAWVAENIVFCTNKKLGLYSLALGSSGLMNLRLKKHRDKARLTLLHAAYIARLKMSEVAGRDLDGVSPSLEARYATQEVLRPDRFGQLPSLNVRFLAKFIWPRVVEQLNLKVGLVPGSSDKLIRYSYYSFPSLKAVQEASNDSSLSKDMTITQLALCIGISPRLLTSFIHKPENHYRTFKIPKKCGGEREIASPRFFLKTIQFWLKSYFLDGLKVHDACHAYATGRSIISNANLHVGKCYVANIDIENFFGSITKDHVFRLLRKHEIGQHLAGAISRLVVLNGSIPQGAPTSPVISNAVLFEVDQVMSVISAKKGLVYTRYADDITISGDSKAEIIELIGVFSAELQKFGMTLKDTKTRVASNRASQRVTGLVVNSGVMPPKDYRKKIRAIFDHAYKKPMDYSERIDELRGYVSYLNAFEAMRESHHLRKYKMVLKKISAVSRHSSNGGAETAASGEVL